MGKSKAALFALCAYFFISNATAFASPPETPETPAAAPALETQQPQSQTKRVALIPLIDNTGGWLSRSGAERLMDRMDRELHIPLNDTMRWVDFINEDEAAAALREALSSQGKKAKPELAARDAAQILGADLVLFMVMERCYQCIFHSWHWDGETYIESYAALTVYGYDKRHDRLIRVPASRFERTDYNPAYEAEELAMEALDEALREAHAKDAIFPLSSGTPTGAEDKKINLEQGKGE